MAKKKIILGLIGCCGNMQRAHVPRLIEDGRVKLGWVGGYGRETGSSTDGEVGRKERGWFSTVG